MKIYVSSTFEDLKEFRHAVYGQLRKLSIDAVAMEDYVASEKRPLAKCLEDVAKSDIYVGIFAWRYGYIPKEGNPESRSITELEYRAAETKERLIFLLRDDAPWIPSLMDTTGGSGKQIKRLREELGTRHSVAFFSTPDELAKEVSAAVTNVLLRPITQLHEPEHDSQGTTAGTLSPEFSPDSNDELVMSWRGWRQGLEVASNVGRIENVARHAIASGFLIAGTSLHERLGSELYLVTPAHVIVREQTLESFGLTVDEALFNLTVPFDREEPIRLTEIAWFSPVDELDLSVVRLERQPKSTSGVCLAKTLPQLARTSEALTDAHRVFGFDSKARVFVIGHPGGGDLYFSRGFLLAHNDAALQYVAQTKPGMGGSPVLDDDWRAIGVHRLRGNLPRLSGEGRVDACQAVSLLAVREALRKEFD